MSENPYADDPEYKAMLAELNGQPSETDFKTPVTPGNSMEPVENGKEDDDECKKGDKKNIETKCEDGGNGGAKGVKNTGKERKPDDGGKSSDPPSAEKPPSEAKAGIPNVHQTPSDCCDCTADIAINTARLVVLDVSLKDVKVQLAETAERVPELTVRIDMLEKDVKKIQKDVKKLLRNADEKRDKCLKNICRPSIVAKDKSELRRLRDLGRVCFSIVLKERGQTLSSVDLPALEAFMRRVRDENKKLLPREMYILALSAIPRCMDHITNIFLSFDFRVDEGVRLKIALIYVIDKKLFNRVIVGGMDTGICSEDLQETVEEEFRKLMEKTGRK